MPRRSSWLRISGSVARSGVVTAAWLIRWFGCRPHGRRSERELGVFGGRSHSASPRRGGTHFSRHLCEQVAFLRLAESAVVQSFFQRSSSTLQILSTCLSSAAHDVESSRSHASLHASSVRARSF